MNEEKLNINPVADDAMIKITFLKPVKSDGVVLPREVYFSMWFSCNPPIEKDNDCVIGYEWIYIPGYDNPFESFGGEFECNGTNIVNVTDLLSDVLDFALDDGLSVESIVSLEDCSDLQ